MDIPNFKGKDTNIRDFYIKFPHFNYKQFMLENNLNLNEKECIKYILENKKNYELQDKVFMQTHKTFKYFNILLGFCISYKHCNLINFDKYHIKNLNHKNLKIYDEKITYILIDSENINTEINKKYTDKIILYVNTLIDNTHMCLINKYNIEHFITKNNRFKNSLLTKITDYKVIAEKGDFDKCFHEIYNYKKKYEIIPEKIKLYM